MNTQIIITLDSNIAEFANSFSEKVNKPISEIIENYFITLQNNNNDISDLPQDLAELYGIFEGIETPDKKELRRMFHDKDNY
ncbi:MAG: DUF6364 family protein [Planctomycetaceae bacterium]|jgi:hypothetical protein|nr:DUF6364 family protein [Planctomycetaceae bacterium]